MNKNVKLEKLEQEVPLDIRIETALETNPEYLRLSIESFLEKYQPLLRMGDKLEAYETLKKLCINPNFHLMYSFYNFYFDINGKEQQYSSDLCKLSSITKTKELERAFCSDIGGVNFEGIISPEGIYYPALKSHYCLCAWLNLNGIDIRRYVRSFMGSKSRILFSDLSGYISMDKEKDFALTENQVKAMETLFRIKTRDSKFASFHNAIEESYRFGFCKFLDTLKTHKQIKLFEDILGKRQIDSREILSTKIKYY